MKAAQWSHPVDGGFLSEVTTTYAELFVGKERVSPQPLVGSVMGISCFLGGCRSTGTWK